MKSFLISLSGVLALPLSGPLGATAMLPLNLTDDVHVMRSPADRSELMFLDISSWDILVNFVGDPLQNAAGLNFHSDASKDQQSQDSSGGSNFLGMPALSSGGESGAAGNPGVAGKGGTSGVGGSESHPGLGLDSSLSMPQNMFSGQSPLHGGGLLAMFLSETGNQTSSAFELLKVENHGGVFSVQVADSTTDPVPEPRWLGALLAVLIAVLMIRARVRRKRACLEA